MVSNGFGMVPNASDEPENLRKPRRNGLFHARHNRSLLSERSIVSRLRNSPQ